jgi:hypothetical protein
MPGHDDAINPSTNVVSQVKNDAVVETCVKVVNKDIEKKPVAAPAPPADKEAPKKTYASIVSYLLNFMYFSLLEVSNI